jgi:RNA polymerase sporulation-specific sigma factor
MVKVDYAKNEELVKKAKNGDTDAEVELLLNNDRLCFHIAKRFLNTGLDIEDLASMAKIGLVKAYNKFSIDKETKFATFASRVMTNEILMYLRGNKKNKDATNLEQVISKDVDGNELTLMDVIPIPEEDITMEDREEMQYVLKIFNDNASERDKIILQRCILNNENQRDVAKDLGTSQSYVSRLARNVEKSLKYIVENNKYKRFSAKREKEEKSMGKTQYTQEHYFYILNTRPELSVADISKLMGTFKQSIYNYKKKWDKAKYEIEGVETNNLSQEFMDKVRDFIPSPKKEKVTPLKEALKIPEKRKEIRDVIIQKSIEDNYEALKMLAEHDEKKEISNDELIILNNKISITSSRDEVSQLVYGIYHLLLNNPADVKIKLDLHFEVSK